MENGTSDLAKGWRVVRQDTNGAQVVELDNTGEEAARAFAQKREEQIGHHKQTVWHERVPENKPRPA